MWWEDVDWIIRVIEVLVIAVLVVSRWIQAREGGEKKLRQDLEALTERVAAKVHVNDHAALRRDLDDLCGRVDKKADAAVAVTEAMMLRALADDRHQLRDEMDVKLGRLVSLERYNSDQRSTQSDIDRLMKRVFNGGLAGV